MRAMTEFAAGQNRVSVVVVEDDEELQTRIRRALERSPFEIVGEADTAAEAQALIEREHPEVVIVDDGLPESGGTQLVRELRAAGIEAAAVVMTATKEPGFNELARAAGAQATVLKTTNLADLPDVLGAVAEGRVAFDRRVPKQPPASAALSPREHEVLELVARGATNREIAAELGVGEETIKTLVQRIFVKLGVRRRAEAVAKAHERGLL